mmetsp:Transcript_107434/g.314129  ORF Transcript_107434/g.314129 Transcript_107434/m.314129 type:complete len:214 (-) Transcript_107434:171-812(-)
MRNYNKHQRSVGNSASSSSRSAAECLGCCSSRCSTHDEPGPLLLTACIAALEGLHHEEHHKPGPGNPPKSYEERHGANVLCQRCQLICFIILLRLSHGKFLLRGSSHLCQSSRHLLAYLSKEHHGVTRRTGPQHLVATLVDAAVGVGGEPLGDAVAVTAAEGAAEAVSAVLPCRMPPMLASVSINRHAPNKRSWCRNWCRSWRRNWCRSRYGR